MSRIGKTMTAAAALGGVLAALSGCGSKTATPLSDVPKVTGTNTVIQLSQEGAASLKKLNVTLGVTGDAKLEATSLTIPVTGGHVAVYAATDAVPPVQGELTTGDSGLTVTSGSTTVTMSNLRIELLKNTELIADVTVGSAAPQTDVEVLDFDNSTARQSIADGMITLSGATVYLASPAADLLNTAFSSSSYTGGVGSGIKLGSAIVDVDSAS